MKHLRAALVTILVFMGVFIGNKALAQYQAGDSRYIFSGAIGAGLVVGPVVWLLVAQKRHPVTQEEMEISQESGKPVFSGRYTLVSGLDLPAGVKCRVSYHSDHLSIEAVEQLYTLPNERVLNAAVSTIRDVQGQYVSSAGGALAGGMLFGPVGALLGGMVQNRQLRTTTRLLLFTYTSAAGEMKYLVFDVGERPSDSAHRFAAVYGRQQSPGPKAPIEL